MGRQFVEQFKYFKQLDLTLLEQSLSDLSSSAKSAFPDTSKRHKSLNSVRVTHVTYDRPDNDKLLVTATVEGETNKYTTSILFDSVQFVNPDTTGSVDIGATQNIMPLSHNSTDCKVMCECLDFYYTFAWYDFNKDSLYGKPQKPYEKVPGSNRPPRNPSNAPGICKHLMKVADHLQANGILKS